MIIPYIGIGMFYFTPMIIAPYWEFKHLEGFVIVNFFVCLACNIVVLIGGDTTQRTWNVFSTVVTAFAVVPVWLLLSQVLI